MDLELTQHQQQALERIRAFVDDDEGQVFVLRGYAGTGKTTLAGVVIEWINEERSDDWRCVLLASTGRAARVLTERTGYGATTVHSHIYQFSVVNEEERKQQEQSAPPRKSDLPRHVRRMQKRGEQPPPDPGTQLTLEFELRRPGPEREGAEKVDTRRILYLVDEASMLSHLRSMGEPIVRFGSGVLLKDFFRYAFELDRRGNKIIFIGDPAQLPPVVERNPFSPALDPKFLVEHFHLNARGVEMTRIVRHAEGHPILQLATRLRERLSARQYDGWEEVLKEAEGHAIFTPYTQKIMMERYLEKVQEEGFEKAIVITHSNNQAYQLNIMMRKMLHGRYHDLPQEGEILMVTQNNHATDLANGDQVVVRKVGKISKHRGIRFVEVVVEPLHHRAVTVEIEVPDDLAGLISGDALPQKPHEKSSRGIRMQMLLDFLHEPRPNLEKEVVRELLIDFDQRMRKQGVSRNTDDYKDAMFTDPWLNALRAKFGYVVTCHKAQGGEWDHVFLNLSETIERYLGPEQRLRWLYTAVTRAKNFLDIKHIYRQPRKSKRPRVRY